MKRILIMGNSHTACIRKAWNNMGGEVPFEIDFFVAIVPHARHLRLNRNLEYGDIDNSAPRRITKILKQLNGCTVIDLKKYDAIIRVGNRTFPTDLVIELLDRFDVDGLSLRESAHRLSRNCFAGMAEPILHKHAKRAVFNRKKGWDDSAPPLIVAPAPRPSEKMLEEMANGLLRKNPHPLSEALDMLDEKFSHEVRKWGVRAVIPQPPKAISSSGLTHNTYSQGSYTARGELHNDSDLTHMNVAWGELRLKQISDAVAELLT